MSGSSSTPGSRRLSVSFGSHQLGDPASHANALRPFKPKVVSSNLVGRADAYRLADVYRMGLSGEAHDDIAPTRAPPGHAILSLWCGRQVLPACLEHQVLRRLRRPALSERPPLWSPRRGVFGSLRTEGKAYFLI